MKFKVLILTAILLGGCSLLGIKSGLSFDQQLASAYTVHTAVEQTTTAALQAGIITSADSDKVIVMANTSRSFLDAARVAEKAVDTAGASTKLQLAVNVLASIQSFLNTSKTTAAKATAAKAAAKK
jgi:hypothetical protein